VSLLQRGAIEGLILDPSIHGKPLTLVPHPYGHSPRKVAERSASPAGMKRGFDL
jgi:hypothetical protein